jgi:hypothetical protein
MTVTATADVSCRLLEVDGAGIEAVLTGRRQMSIDSEHARQYIRLARLGMHAAVTARAVDQPADLSWPDDYLGKYLKEIKAAHPKVYDISKRVVHGSNYGLTEYGLVEKFPEYFPNLAAARRQFDFYYATVPALKPQQDAVRKQAFTVGYLGGPQRAQDPPSQWFHEYGYRHWFWDVLSYQPCDEFTARKWLRDPARKDRIIQLHGRWFKIRPGNDWNRAVAFYPQSTAAGWLKEKQLRLFTPWSPDYIGDCYFGRTPLLGPIHDSLLLHIPVRCWDRVVETVCRVMQEPSTYLPIPESWGWGPFLPIGISAKAGKNWAPSLTDEAIAKIQAKAASEGKEIPQLTANPDGMEDIDVPAWTPPEVRVPHAGPDDPVLPDDADDEDALDDWRALERHVA